jgi:hypothetical protein
MIRPLLRFIAPVAAIGATAAALVGPSLLAGPRGEALVLAPPTSLSPVARVSLGSSDCASLQLLAENAGRSMVLAWRLPSGEHLAIAEIPDGAGATLLMIFDGHGNLAPLTGPEALGELSAALAQDCAGPAEAAEPAGAI